MKHVNIRQQILDIQCPYYPVNPALKYRYSCEPALFEKLNERRHACAGIKPYHICPMHHDLFYLYIIKLKYPVDHLLLFLANASCFMAYVDNASELILRYSPYPILLSSNGPCEYLDEPVQKECYWKEYLLHHINRFCQKKSNSLCMYCCK